MLLVTENNHPKLVLKQVILIELEQKKVKIRNRNAQNQGCGLWLKICRLQLNVNCI